MTWGEYLAYSLGKYRRDVEKWEQIRRLAFTSASSFQKLEIGETEFMPLPFDANANEIEYIPDELLDQII